MFGKLSYYSLKLRYVRHFESSTPTGLRSSFDRFDHDVRIVSLVHSQVFVLLLYTRDTTRMVGRQVNCTPYSYLSLLNTQTACITINPLQLLPPNSLHIPNSAAVNAQSHP